MADWFRQVEGTISNLQHRQRTLAVRPRKRPPSKHMQQTECLYTDSVISHFQQRTLHTSTQGYLRNRDTTLRAYISVGLIDRAASVHVTLYVHQGRVFAGYEYIRRRIKP